SVSSSGRRASRAWATSRLNAPSSRRTLPPTADARRAEARIERNALVPCLLLEDRDPEGGLGRGDRRDHAAGEPIAEPGDERRQLGRSAIRGEDEEAAGAEPAGEPLHEALLRLLPSAKRVHVVEEKGAERAEASPEAVGAARRPGGDERLDQLGRGHADDEDARRVERVEDGVQEVRLPHARRAMEEGRARTPVLDERPRRAPRPRIALPAEKAGEGMLRTRRTERDRERRCRGRNRDPHRTRPARRFGEGRLDRGAEAAPDALPARRAGRPERQGAVGPRGAPRRGPP